MKFQYFTLYGQLLPCIKPQKFKIDQFCSFLCEINKLCLLNRYVALLSEPLILIFVSDRMRENTDQNNSEYEHFLRSDGWLRWACPRKRNDKCFRFVCTVTLWKSNHLLVQYQQWKDKRNLGNLFIISN